jgi:hypothetical protein
MKLQWMRLDRSEKVRFLAALWIAGSLALGINVRNAEAALQEQAPPQEEASRAGPRVALSELTGTPGASLMMPFYFTPDPNNSLRSLEVDIEFVSNNLKFQKASPGLAAEQVNATVESSVIDGQPDENGRVYSKLHIKASVPNQAAGEGLPDGLLAYLLFQISLEAKPFRIRLTPSVTATEPVLSAQQIATEEGFVNVEALDVMPEATCFFFSH